MVAPRLGPDIPLSGKLKREGQATRRMEEIESRLQHFPHCPQRRDAWRETLLQRTRELAGSCLGFPTGGLQLLFNRDGLEATRAFVRAAKSFDPDLKDESLFQALRNLWIVNTIQLLLDQPLSVSPAIFGYSMLYPWTDNYLDDPSLPAPSKLAFGEWLEQRLGGAAADPADAHAAQVSQLVALIEGCFPRAGFAEVYLSLQAIHHAQMASLRQQRSAHGMSGRELLRTTFQKGGASVLPDAYLAAGSLSEAEAEFMFGFGALLQLIDDLQDLQADLANGHSTLFAQPAGGLLDGATTRLWSFAQAVLWSPGPFDAPKHRPVKELIQESCKLMVLQAVARNQRLYSPDFAAQLEAASPFRFCFMRDRETAAAREGDKMLSLLRRQRRLGSAFDLLN
jgi:hypothetical protein